MKPTAEHLHPSQAPSAAGAVPVATPVGALLARHVLRDGEIVQLILKPSLWFIPLSCLPFATTVALALWLAVMRYEQYALFYVQAAVFLVAGRLVIATLQWMGRLYILTDLRILRLAGVFNVDIFDCPLRRVSAVTPLATWRERALRLGSIAIAPLDSSLGVGLWQTVAHPTEVHRKILAAIDRARQGPNHGPAPSAGP